MLPLFNTPECEHLDRYAYNKVVNTQADGLCHMLNTMEHNMHHQQMCTFSCTL